MRTRRHSARLAAVVLACALGLAVLPAGAPAVSADVVPWPPPRNGQRVYGRIVKPSDPIVVAGARYLGRPYLWGGRGPNYDCAGYVLQVYEDLRRPLGYAMRPGVPSTAAALGYSVGTPLPYDPALWRPGDLIVMNSRRDRSSWHVVIWVGNGIVIGSHGSSGRTAYTRNGGLAGQYVTDGVSYKRFSYWEGRVDVVAVRRP